MHIHDKETFSEYHGGLQKAKSTSTKACSDILNRRNNSTQIRFYAASTEKHQWIVPRSNLLMLY